MTPDTSAPSDDELEDSSATIIQGPSDGATVIMDRSALQGGAPGAKLVFLSGPKSGAEVKLTSQETTLGRQSDNAVVIPDISVSRHHVAVRRKGASYVLVDLGSGNGSILNGERIEGEAVLQDGDVFAMGDTEVRFEMPAPPPRRPAALARRGDAPGEALSDGSDRATPKDVPALEDATATTEVTGHRRLSKRRLLIAGGAAAVMIALIVAVKLKEGREAPAVPSAQDQEIAAMGARMAQLAEDGKKALNSGDYRAAFAALSEAHDLGDKVGLDENDLRTLRRQADYAKGLVGGQEALEKAQAAGAQLQFAQAMALLQPYTGEDHALHDTAFKIIAQLKARAYEKLAAGKEALAAKNYDQVRQVLEELKAVDPNMPESKELDGLLRDATQAHQQVALKKQQAAAPAKDPLAAVAAAVAEGKIEDAIAAATAANAKAVKADLVALRDGCKDLDADGALRRCQELLQRIPGGEGSPLAEPIHRRSASAALADGIKAMGAENWSKAYQAFHQAQRADPSNPVALKNLRTIRAKAKELFEQAYVDRGVDADKARREFEAVISMTGPDDELHQKSKVHLRKMGGE